MKIIRPILSLLLPCLLTAQQVPTTVENFPKPAYVRQAFFQPQLNVDLQGPARFQEFVVDTPVGKQLTLTLRNYLELVMANNTNIALQRLTVETFKDAVTRAFAAFDPTAVARWTSTKQKSPVTNILDSIGTTSNTTIATLTQPANFTYNQTLQQGLQFSASYSGQKTSTTSANSLFNPLVTSNLSFNFTQPLIRNRGYYINRVPIMVAKYNLGQQQFVARNAIIGLVQAAESAYWDAVLARDNLRVQQEALKLADAALKRAQQELDLGAMSPLDIYNPQQNKATAEISVAQAEYTLAQTLDAMRRQMGADLSPEYRSMPIKLTESVEMAIEPPPINVDSSISRALAERPDLKALQQAVVGDDYSIRGAANELRPDLSLIGSYSAYGRGGNFLTNRAGFGESLSELFSFGYPTYTFGLQLRFPIRNHTAVADLADAVAQKKIDTLSRRNIQQQIRLDILTAINQVESAKKSVGLAKIALDFAHKYLDAEQKKYDLGTSTVYFVLQAQQALVNADFAVVQNTVAYRRNLLNLAAKTGTLLEERGIAVQ